MGGDAEGAVQVCRICGRECVLRRRRGIEGEDCVCRRKSVPDMCNDGATCALLDVCSWMNVAQKPPGQSEKIRRQTSKINYRLCEIVLLSADHHRTYIHLRHSSRWT